MRRIAWIAAACLILTLSMISLAQGPAGNLRLGVMADARNLNPYMGYGSTETFITGFVYDRLLSWSPEEGLGPGLADSFEIKDGGRTLEFKLNPNAKWQDGRPLTAADVEFTFNFIQQKRFPGFMAILGNLAGAKALDSRTVQLQLRNPSAGSPRLFGTAVSIAPKHVWESIADPVNFPNLTPMGSGPFTLSERREGQFITLKNTGSHYRWSYNIDTMTLRLVRDETMGIMSLRQGDLDALLWAVDPSVAEEITKNPRSYPGVKVASAPSSYVRTLMFNLRNAPWNDITLRRAISLAVNQQALIDQVLLGYGRPQGPGLVAPTEKYYNSSLPPVPRNVALARSLLDGAGYVDRNRDGLREDKDGKPMRLEILVTNVPAQMNAAELLVNQIKEIGIDARFTPLTAEALRNRQMAADFDSAIMTISFANADMMFFYYHTSRGVINQGRVAGFNYGGHSDPEYDKIAEAMQVEMNEARRNQLLRDLQVKVANAYYHIPLFTSDVLMLYRDDRFTGWVVKPESGINNDETFMNLRLRGGR